jgi:AraC family transcriptional regulator
MPGHATSIVPEMRELGAANALLTARGRRHAVHDFAGPLSIKTVLDGRVAWKTEGRDIWVDESCFVVLNDGQPYSMELDAREPVTTSCVFFKTHYVESVARDLSRPAGCLLDDPDGAGGSLTFVSRLHPRDHSVIPAMRALRERALAGAPSTEMEERYLLLARSLLLAYEEMRRQMARIPAARAATRLEMLRRASRGREFLHAQACGPLSLEEAARAACLSAYHFHRVFRAAFGETPHAYLTGLRLERAKQLLGQGVPVTEVCGAVGFESLGSFSALFRKHAGVPPSRFRG